MIRRLAPPGLLLFLAACGGRGGLQRPDYEADARALCDQAEATSDPHRALALFKLAIEADPNQARAHHGRAVLLEQTGRSPEAERSFSMAVDVARDDVRSRHLLERARYHRRQGRTEAAVRDLDRAVSLLDTWPLDAVAAEVRLMRAESRILLRAWEGAREDLDAAERAGLDAAQRERARTARARVDTEKPEGRQ